MTKRSFPMSNDVPMWAVLQDQGPVEGALENLDKNGGMTISHQYQVVALFVDEDHAHEWKGYAKDGDTMTVCRCDGVRSTVDLTRLFDPED